MRFTSNPMEQIHALVNQITEKQSQLVELKKQVGYKQIEDYTLQGPNGDIKLSELFDGRKDLIIIHNMGTDCAYCTLWADGFNGLVPHLEDRAAFVVVSPDSPDVQQAFAAERGWIFRMYSGMNSSFIEDMGFTYEDDDGGAHWMPGVSTFQQTADGSIYRVGWDFFGPGDEYCSLWHLFDLLANGADGWEPKFNHGDAA